MIVPSEILGKKFDRSTVGGYKIEDVDAYLREVSADFQSVSDQRDELVAKIQVLAEKIEEYRNEEDSLKTTLVAAQKLSNSLVKEAQDKADEILAQARVKADRLIEDASGAIELEHEAFNRLKKEVADFKNKVLTIYKSHIEILNDLPDTYEPLSRKQPEPQPEPAPEPEIEPKPPEQHTETKAFEPVREEVPRKSGIAIADEIVAEVIKEAVPEPESSKRAFSFGQGITSTQPLKPSSFEVAHAEPLKFGDNFSFDEGEKRKKR